jgi:hypothetical protein
MVPALVTGGAVADCPDWGSCASLTSAREVGAARRKPSSSTEEAEPCDEAERSSSWSSESESLSSESEATEDADSTSIGPDRGTADASGRERVDDGKGTICAM